MQLIVHFMLKLWIPRVNAVAKAEQKKKIELLCDIISRKDQNSKPKDSFLSTYIIFTPL